MKELHRLARVVDMMATMHSVLAQRYRTWALWTDLALLGAATVVVALTFADPDQLAPLGLSAPHASSLLGVASVAVFFLSVVILVVDWKGLSGRHKEAFDALIGLKADLREASKRVEITAEEIASVVGKANLVMSRLAAIPDHQFNRLKAIHLRKVEVSRMLSQYPGSSARLMAIRVWLYANHRSGFGVRGAAKPPPTTDIALPPTEPPHEHSA